MFAFLQQFKPFQTKLPLIGFFPSSEFSHSSFNPTNSSPPSLEPNIWPGVNCIAPVHNQPAPPAHPPICA